MRVRRLRLSYSSDDELENDCQHQQQQQPNENSHHQHQPQNPNLPQVVSLSSDDEDQFIDVTDHFSPPQPQPAPPPPPQASIPSAQRLSPSSGCPVGDMLARMGLRLKRECLDTWLRAIGDSNMDLAAKAKFCFGEFLFADMNRYGEGVLPLNVESMHSVDLPGPFILQVDEIVNISCTLKKRYQEAHPGLKRCLKLSMTDGVQRVFGIEYRPIKDLQVLAPAGMKVAVCNVHIRHGLLLLVPEALEVLGGMVEEFDAARQRLVDEVNKPPRGRRSRTQDFLPLAARATMAAWPLEGVDSAGDANVSTSVNAHTSTFGTVPGDRNRPVEINQQAGNSDAVPADAPAEPNGLAGNHPVESNRPVGNSDAVPAILVQNSARFANAFRNSNCSVGLFRQTGTSTTGVEHSNSSMSQGSASFRVDGPGNSSVAPEDKYNLNVTGRQAIPESAASTTPSQVSGQEMDIDSPPVRVTSAVPNHYSDAMVTHVDSPMVDEREYLSRDQEVPFTYLANLSAKWAAMKDSASSVLGKVKCFLTGVKGFHYKQRTTYELQVYVDDGSLISEIIIDHNVVQKGISYSPEEVTAALSSSDRKKVTDMREALKKFQRFLANFEGTMLVEMSSASSLPVAIEMNQGCLPSDAICLLRRLKSSLTVLTRQQHPSDPIDISP